MSATEISQPRGLRAQFAFVAIAMMLVLCVQSVYAAGIRIVRVNGMCEYQRGAEGWQRITARTPLQEGDRVRTAAHSSVTVGFADGSQTLMGAKTVATLHDDSAPDSKSQTKGLVELARGSLRMKIQHSRESLRTRATTATAVIGVRGTEFFIQGDEDKTVVGVTKGIVSVANINQPEAAIDVNAGAKTIVYAGQPPLPPTPLSAGESREASGGGSALDRIEDVAIEETEQIPIEKFIAFSDLHIDAIRNPAYATLAEHSESQVFSRASVTSHHADGSPDGFAIPGATVTDVSSNRGQSSNGQDLWATTFRPTSRGDVIGGFGVFQWGNAWDNRNFNGTATVGGVPTAFTQDGTADSPDLSSQFNAFDVGLIAAHPLSHLDMGIQLRFRDSNSHSDSIYRQAVPGLPADSESSSANGSANLQELILGARKTTRGGLDLGWAIGRRDSHSDIRESSHFIDSVASPLQRSAETFDGWHTELRARKILSDHWRWGASLRMVSINGSGDLVDSTGIPSREAVTDQFYRLGFGVGYTPSSHTAIGADLVGALRDESAIQHYLSGNTKEDESERNPSVAFHVGGQHWLSDRTFFFFDTTMLRRRIDMKFLSYADVPGSPPVTNAPDRHTENLSEWMLGYGYRVAQDLWLEYLLVEPITAGEPKQHNLLMRWRK